MTSTEPAAPLGPPPEPRTARRVRTRHRVLALTAIVGVALGAAGLFLGSRGGGADSMDGPRGVFPPALASAAPVHTARQVATLEYGSTVYRGLGIQAGRGSQDATAVNLRTGKPYWRYARQGDRIAASALDPQTGRLFLLWESASDITGGRAHVTLVDARKGRIGWDVSLPKGISPYSPWFAIGPRVVAIVDSGWMTGLDQATGRRRWTLRQRCDVTSEAMTSATILLSHACGHTAELAAYDLATGARRWARPATGWFPGIAHPATHLAFVGTLDERRFVVWGWKQATVEAATGRTLAEHDDPFSTEKLFAAGVEYRGCAARGSSTMALCASDPATGRLLWRRAFPEPRGLLVGRSVAVADGRVYALAGPGGDYCDRLMIADARTGALLASVPAPPAVKGMAELDITDGVLNVRVTHVDDRDPLHPKRIDVLFAER